MENLKFQILGTSSSGNCAVLRSRESCILIDAGFTGKRIKDGLAELGMTIGDVDAVFFTHEHRDHTAGVPGLSSAQNLQFFANKLTADAIEKRYSRKLDWKYFETGTRFEFLDFTVTNFAIQHDTDDPVGFVFESGGERLAWVTDIGKMTNVVRRHVQDVDVLVMESNYDLKMLNDSARPEELKARIRGSHGHLSNDACGEFLCEYENERLQKIFFAHISKECNTPGKVEKIACENCRSGIPFSVVNPANFLPENGGFGF